MNDKEVCDSVVELDIEVLNSSTVASIINDLSGKISDLQLDITKLEKEKECL